MASFLPGLWVACGRVGGVAASGAQHGGEEAREALFKVGGAQPHAVGAAGHDRGGQSCLAEYSPVVNPAMFTTPEEQARTISFLGSL